VPGYANRPPPSEPLRALDESDFEPVSGPPRSPFHRQTPIEPIVPRPLPPLAPGSLMPVAMGGVDASGPNQSIEIVVPVQPTFKTGFMILAAGAILGGVLGIVLRPPPRADVAAASEPFPPPPAIYTPAFPGGPVIPAPAPTASLVLAPPVAPDAKDVRNTKDVRDAKSEKSESSKAGKHLKGHVRKGERPEKNEKREDDGYRIASAEPTTTPKEAKESPASKKASPAPPAKPTPSPAKGSDDAMNVLKAATGSLENTL
jgi:hypothetical protein